MQYVSFGNDKQADLNLYVCGRDENLPPGARFGPAIRDSYIIECCTGGYGSVIINGIEFPLKRGDCAILLPGDAVIHTASETEPRCGVWCGVKGMKINRYLHAAGIDSKHPYAAPAAFQSVTEQVEALLAMQADNDPGADLRRGAHIHMLFGEIMRYASKTTDSDLYIEKALHIIETRYCERINVADIASELGLERCYFSTLFRQKTGDSPHNFLTKFRIKRACTLLHDMHFPISEVAYAVAIEPQNFARVFKKVMGMLPTEYIQKKAD